METGVHLKTGFESRLNYETVHINGALGKNDLRLNIKITNFVEETHHDVVRRFKLDVSIVTVVVFGVERIVVFLCDYKLQKHTKHTHRQTHKHTHILLSRRDVSFPVRL